MGCCSLSTLTDTLCAFKEVSNNICESIFDAICNPLSMDAGASPYTGSPVVPSALVLVPIDFIDKIVNAFVKIMTLKTDARLGKRTIDVSVSEMELYMLRELCISRLTFNEHRVGLTLKKKVLFALYQNKQRTIDIIEQLLEDIDLGDTK